MRLKIIFALAVHLTSTFFPYYIPILPKDSFHLALSAPFQIGTGFELPKRPPDRQAESKTKETPPKRKANESAKSINSVPRYRGQLGTARDPGMEKNTTLYLSHSL